MKAYVNMEVTFRISEIKRGMKIREKLTDINIHVGGLKRAFISLRANDNE